MKLKAIVMDMDGTITKFNLDFLGARRQALEELDRLNLRTPEMTEQLSVYLLLRKLHETLEPEVFVKLRGQFYDILERMEVKAAQEVTVYPGIVETLKELRRRGLKIGIVTNNGRKGTTLTLERYRLASFFGAVVTRDDCEEMKPDGGSVKKVLADLGVLSDEAMLVGDGVIDIMAARATGLLAVAVATGPLSGKLLLGAGPDYLLGSVNDLPLLVDSLETASPK